ncbi:hypothetical protein NVP1087A_01 [Vibrio phage 1.087.A._10N.261.45.F9]|nr:hypothetical protein NVP1087A_01 [Vibrio phage 1.087.A._10N.261.45.F9]
MSSRLYSANKISEALGLSRQYVNKYCTKHCNDARVGSGKGARIDINHPAMIALFESKGVDHSADIKPAPERVDPQATKPVSQSESKSAMAKARASSSTKAKPKDKKVINGRENLEAIDITEHGKLTIDEIAAFFGSAPDYRDWLDAKKKQVEVIEKETKIKITLGEYIRKDVVDTSFIGVVDAFNSRLLTDFCKSAPIDLRPAFESGKDDIQIESLIRTMLEKEIVTIVKAQARFADD